jgi:hypothetical protein
MALKVDMNKAKRKAAEEAAKAAARANMTRTSRWKPAQGKNRIRIMPPWASSGPNAYQFWRELYVHWGVGPDEESSTALACPRLSQDGPKGPCPVCAEVERLKATKDPANVELAKELRAKQRSFSNIIDIEDPIWKQENIDELIAAGADSSNVPKVGTTKVQEFSYGPTILKQLLDFYTEEIDFTDLDAGHTVIITREGQGLKTDYRVILDTKQTKAPVKGEPKLQDLDKIMPFREPAEMLAILEGLDPGEVKALAASTSAAEEAVEEVVAEEEEAEAVEEDDGSNGEGEVPEDELEEAAAVQYPPCYGAECDPKDSVCNTDCQLFAECKTKCGIVDEPPKPKRQAAPKPAAAGKHAVATKSPATGKAVGGADDLIAQMKAAVGEK